MRSARRQGRTWRRRRRKGSCTDGRRWCTHSWACTWSHWRSGCIEWPPKKQNQGSSKRDTVRPTEKCIGDGTRGKTMRDPAVVCKETRNVAQANKDVPPWTSSGNDENQTRSVETTTRGKSSPVIYLGSKEWIHCCKLFKCLLNCLFMLNMSTGASKMVPSFASNKI